MSGAGSLLQDNRWSRYARTLRFAAVGLAATLAYAVIATGFHATLPVPAAISSGLAYAICAAGSYIGHRWFTFRGIGPKRHGAKTFFILSLTGHALSIVIPAILSDSLGFPTAVSTLATCTIIPLASALLTSKLVFGVSLMAETTRR